MLHDDETSTTPEIYLHITMYIWRKTVVVLMLRSKENLMLSMPACSYAYM